MDLEKSKYSVLWQKNPGKVLFWKYGEILMHPVSKFLVVGLTIGLSSIGEFTHTSFERMIQQNCFSSEKITHINFSQRNFSVKKDFSHFLA